MRYLPRLSLSVWALLALLAGSSVACLAPAFGADQKPLVINPTTGRTEQIQSGNNLNLPANGYTQANTYTDPAANYNPFLIDTTTSIPGGNNAFQGSNRFIMRTSGANNFTQATAAIRGVYASAIHNGTGTATGVIGGNFDVSATSTGGVTSAYTIRAGGMVSSAANVIASGSGVYVGAPSVSGGGAITTFSGLNIEPLTQAGTNIAINTQGAGLVRIRDTTSASAPTTGAVVIGDQTTATTNLAIGQGRIHAGGNNFTFGNTGNTSQSVVAQYDEGAVQIQASGTNNFFDTNIRPNSGVGGFLSFTESGVADRWSVGILTADSTLYFNNNRTATAGTSSPRMQLSSTGNLTLPNVGSGLLLKEGTNAKMGAATLVAGTVTVNTTAVTANSRIYLTGQADGGTVGFQRVSARSAGTSFTITSSNVLDTSTVAWMIVEPAP